MKKHPIIWTNVILFSLTFLVAAIAVPYYALTVGFTAAEIIERQTAEENNQSAQKGMRIQLVLIYLAIIVLLFLMAFYI